MPVANQTIVSIASDFLTAFAGIPREQQKRVREFVQQFQVNPERPGGRCYEELPRAADAALKSLRIDPDCCAIVAHPRENVFVLLWVAKPADAAQWAGRKRLEIHPKTGALQIFQAQEGESAAAAPPAPGGLFTPYSREQLLSLGVPEELLERTYAIQSEADLENGKTQFPPEAYSRLFLLAGGEPYAELLESGGKANTAVDTSDFAAALKQDDSRSRFTLLDDALELETLLNTPLAQWRVFLHPLQKKIVEMDASGPVRILGGAGTGKTIVAIHRARHLVRNVFAEKSDRILFTTFTKNLAADISASLRQICSREELERIEVVNLDAWTSNFLIRNGLKFQTIDYLEDKKAGFWEQAMHLNPDESAFSLQFFRDEWEQVIQPLGILTLEEYFRAARLGRGRRLDRRTRKALWPVWEEYRTLLQENNFYEIQDMYRVATVLLRENREKPYRAIIVDEGQDFSAPAWIMIRSLIPEAGNDIFIVGDAHQRIYAHQAVLGKCGIKIAGRSRKLKVNYRTTEQTYRFAASVLTGLAFDDLDGQEDVLGKCQSLTSGPEPQIKCFPTPAAEKEFLKETLRDFQARGIPLSSICIAARKNDLLEEYRAYLAGEQIPACRIETERIASSPREGVRLGTFHRIKGIEFDYVFLTSVCAQEFPPAKLLKDQDNPADREAVLQRERALLYVALTRARKAVFVTGYGTMSALLPGRRGDPNGQERE